MTQATKAFEVRNASGGPKLMRTMSIDAEVS